MRGMEFSKEQNDDEDVIRFKNENHARARNRCRRMKIALKTKKVSVSSSFEVPSLIKRLMHSKWIAPSRFFFCPETSNATYPYHRVCVLLFVLRNLFSYVHFLYYYQFYKHKNFPRIFIESFLPFSDISNSICFWLLSIEFYSTYQA